MPRPRNPPTPASSTEIKSKDGSQFASLQMSFELPPPAVAGAGAQHHNPPLSSTSSDASSSASSYRPTSPTSPAIPASEVVKIRRRSSLVQAPGKDAFALPPPPTRSRKIIQMKPRAQAEEVMEVVTEITSSSSSKSAAAPKPASSATKKKQPSSTSVAGRKIARKTAHSLIERRRRSKMNEEFATLKDMIPACTGEMHKLAILQASIDYVRYLEDCVTKLKAENSRNNSSPNSDQFMLPPPASKTSYTPRQYQHSEMEDVDMDASEHHHHNHHQHQQQQQHPSPTYSTPILASTRPSASPAMLPQDSHARNRQDSYSSSVSADQQRHYSFSASSTTSPALGPSAYDLSRCATSMSEALTSPALIPQRDRDLDHEATAALLMLNSDRRGTSTTLGLGSVSGRSMSVRDLLSS